MYGRRCNIILETLCRSSVGEINDKMRSVELPIKKIHCSDVLRKQFVIFFPLFSLYCAYQLFTLDYFCVI